MIKQYFQWHKMWLILTLILLGCDASFAAPGKLGDAIPSCAEFWNGIKDRLPTLSKLERARLSALFGLRGLKIPGSDGDMETLHRYAAGFGVHGLDYSEEGSIHLAYAYVHVDYDNKDPSAYVGCMKAQRNEDDCIAIAVRDGLVPTYQELINEISSIKPAFEGEQAVCQWDVERKPPLPRIRTK